MNDNNYNNIINNNNHSTGIGMMSGVAAATSSSNMNMNNSGSFVSVKHSIATVSNTNTSANSTSMNHSNVSTSSQSQLHQQQGQTSTSTSTSSGNNHNNPQQQHVRTSSNMSVTTMSSCSSSGQHGTGSQASGYHKSNAVSSSINIAAMAASLQVPSQSRVSKVDLKRPTFFDPRGIVGGEDCKGKESSHPLQDDQKSSSDLESKSCLDNDDAKNVYSRSLRQLTTYQPVWRGAQLRLQLEVNRFVGKSTSIRKKSKGLSLGTASMDASLQLLSENYAEKVEINTNVGPFSFSNENEKQASAQGKHRKVTSFGSTGSLHLVNDVTGPTVAPLYACDDMALPCDADLGSFETREEEQCYMDIKKEQEHISKVVPNIFGVIKCPCPAWGSDDSNSWKSRLVVRTRERNSEGSSANSQSSMSGHGMKSNKSTSSQIHGWWNMSDQVSVCSQSQSESKNESDNDGRVKSTFIKLQPTLQFLKQANLPATLLHPSTYVANRLPFLSDRLPSYKHLQIETQAITFTELPGEIEPMFCSMAIYHIEGNGSGVPILSRCNRVSETLHFDVVSDPIVEELCSAALWPRGKNQNIEGNEAAAMGTNCGVFALPSSTHLSKLFAVLIVKKVLSEESESEIYAKVATKDQVDLSKSRAKAAKSAEKFGQFLMPFAFGVVDLHKAIDGDSMAAPKSIMVQIPLFKLAAGQGDNPIIDRIQAMQIKTRDASMGLSEPIKGGKASFLLRYFDYLGIQAVVDSVSSLAPDRLIDCTGSIQIRRVNHQRDPSSPGNSNDEGESLRSSCIVAEEVSNGGRNVTSKESNTQYFAQELFPLSLQMNSSSHLVRRDSSRTSRNSSNDCEQFSHTSFMNDLLCRPYRLHGNNKRNIIIKIEHRQCTWDTVSSGFTVGPPIFSIYNQRRGQHLVASMYSSCGYHVQNPSWNEEFKVRLPDVSNESNVLLFSVYNVCVKNKRKTLNIMSHRGGSSKQGTNNETQSSDGENGPLELLGCGILPLFDEGEDGPGSLLRNDNHDVILKYTCRPVASDLFPAGTLVLEPLPQKFGAGTGEKDGLPITKPRMIQKVTSFDNVTKAIAKVAHGPSIASEIMTLQVRVLSLSSVHSQSPPISKVFSWIPRYPKLLTASNKSTIFGVDGESWKKQLNDSTHLYESHIESEVFLDEEKVRIVFVELCKCSPHELSAHLFRIIRQVWRRLIVGTGEPSLLWADPAALIPLRLQSFSTLLYMINAAASFQAKSGLTELDGENRWDLASLASLVVLILDEDSLFATEGVPQEAPYSNTSLEEIRQIPEASNQKKVVRNNSRRHQRDISHGLTGTVDSNDIFASMLKTFAAEDPDSIVPKDDVQFKRLHENSLESKSFFDNTLETVVSDGQIKDDFYLSTLKSSEKSSLLGLSSATGRRKYMTIGGVKSPGLSLATISEKGALNENSEDDSDDSFGIDDNNSNDFEVQVSALPIPVKQMRIPRVSSNESASSTDSPKPVKQMRIPRVSSGETTEIIKEKPKQNKSNSMIDNPEADGGMLDMIGKQIGAIRFSNKDMWGEERLVGTAHTRTLTSQGHRKLRNMCSIDLSLPAFDKILEDEQQLEDKLSFMTEIESIENNTDERSNTLASDSPSSSPTRRMRSPNNGWLDFSYVMKEPIPLPVLRDFTERLMCIHDPSNEKWWPYIYEVIIYQWVALLVEQTQSGDKENNTMITSRYPVFIKSSLNDAAKQAKGITIGGAPLLFEIIKRSLSWRVSQLYGENRPISGEHRYVAMDNKLLHTMEHLISMVTDACIDSRNFDSYVFRKTSIDVNDSIVRFLRDLFAIISHEHVHRLILVYFSRFVMKGGKHWQDRDSKIGLRCSWEVCKLRLNAITLFVRFPDLVEANRPMMKHWEGWSFVEQTHVNRQFFSRSLEQFLNLGMSNFAASDGPVNRKVFEIPERKPHWLIELITDVCLASSEHADQNIQLRGSSLLHELFWNQSQEGKSCGNSSIIASMHVPFIQKVLGHLHYLSSLPCKSQLRKDIMPCVIFVLQSAPAGLLRALWRKLCKQAEGTGDEPDKYGGFGNSLSEILLMHDGFIDESGTQEYNGADGREYSILDLYCLLNLALTTLEYEGHERNNEGCDEETLDQNETWKEEFLEREEQVNSSGDVPPSTNFRKKTFQEEKVKDKKINTTASRRWHAHDCALVICQTSRYVVDEVLRTMSTKNMPYLFSSQLHLKGSREQNRDHTPNSVAHGHEEYGFVLNFSVNDTVVFVRAVTSLYLHILSLQQSDIVVCKTIIASVEILKIFGIKVFLVSVGDTLQHWMRVTLGQCGARRANVRVQALEFLALLLRLTWDTYGSFARVRIPLLAIQMEVMERLVSTTASRFYREQRLLGKPAEFLPNNAAEAALSPLWRTLDRMHNQSGSNNVAFKTALARLAEAMKKLHAAYIAAHALALANRLATSKAVKVPDNDDISFRSVSSHTSNNLGRQFLGLHVATSTESVAHNEAVEDAFLAAANVFKPTELPSHRVAWLRKLAEFHSSRDKYGEEATCRFHIYQTLRQCTAHYDLLWNPSPFLPWAGEAFGYQVDGEGPANSGVDGSNLFGDELSQEIESGNRLDKVETFRKMFYRAASSVRMRTGDWDVTGNKNVFNGVCTPDEYCNNVLAPWFTLREIEEEMVEEIEIAGDLFLKANIEDFSRKSWTLAAEFYSQSYNYPRLCQAYLRLSQVVTSHVPIVDTSNQIELSSHFGRFYRVWFHGSAPDELNGKEFIYRTHVSIRLEEFGNKLVAVLKSLLPEGAPIDLVLDDGRPEMHDGPSGIRNPNASLIREKRPSQRRPVAHVTAGLQPIRDVGVCQIKITPLRPMLRNEIQCRGSLEWFYSRTWNCGFSEPVRSDALKNGSAPLPGHRACRSRSAMGSSIYSGSGSGGGRASSTTGKGVGESSVEGYSSDNGMGGGVDTFSFTQPKQVDRRRGARDWLRTPGDFTEKSLKVTKLLVTKSFPTFVSRQRVSHRSVSKQSPLEAGVEAICSWCSVLFRTVVATNGRAILRGNELIDHGVGRAATKVVADCIHCARVKEMAQVLLKMNIQSNEEETHSSIYGRVSNDKLPSHAVVENQIRLARGIVIYMELLHLLIGRNRDILLRVVKQRRQNRGKETPKHVRSDTSVGSRSMIDRTNDSIAVQSELQRAFIAMAKALYPIISQVLPEEVPTWLRLCSQDGYFSSGMYQQAVLSMSEELLFDGSTNTVNRPSDPPLTISTDMISQSFQSPFIPRPTPSVYSMSFGGRSINDDGQANSVISGDGRSYMSGEYNIQENK